MKKIVLVIGALAMLGAVSCKKDNPEPEAVPTYAEGKYQPIEKIATISEDGNLTQEWTWSNNNLDHIVMAGSGMTTISYTGDFISKVANTGGQKEELRYTYANNMFAGCDIYYNGNEAINFSNMLHGANGKISSADMKIADGFLLSMIGDLFGNGGGLLKTLGKPLTNQLANIAKIRSQMNNGKFEFGGTTMNMAMVWDGDNLKQQIIHGDITMNITTEDIDLLSQFLPIPDEYKSLIELAMMLGGGRLPINIAYNDTANCTYDNNYNPMFCNWTQMFSPQNLSINNATVVEHHGAMTMGITMMGQTTTLANNPLNSTETYIYEYNDKKYPTRMSGETNVIYTYKQ